MKYITEQDKQIIRDYCETQIYSGDTIKPRIVACMLEEKYWLADIIEYIKVGLGIEEDLIYRPECTYESSAHGHLRINVSDAHYKNVYVHQYVVHKELNVALEDVRQFVVHHIDGDKHNNDINNLFVFYDNSSHMIYHRKLRNGEEVNLEKFNDNYIEEEIMRENVDIDKMKTYLKILSKKKAMLVE